MARQRDRNRGRTGGGSGGSLIRHVVIAIIVISMASLVVQSSAFDVFQGDRSSNIDTANDASALVGVDTPPNVPIDGGSGTCTFGENALTLTHGHSEDVDTTRDVIVTGKVTADIETDGCVRTEPGSRVNGDVDAGGDVTLMSGSRIDEEVKAGGDVTLESGSRINDDVDADGDVTLESGSRIDGDVDAGGDVTLESGSRIDGDVDGDGDVTVESGSRIDGNVEAGGYVTVENGGQVTGETTEGGEGTPSDYPRLVTVTNNQNGFASVTVSLLEPSDGTLYLGNDASGSSVTISLGPNDQRDIRIDPSSNGGDDIEFRVHSVKTEDGSTITLDRSVPKSSTSGNDQGGDDGDDDDDDNGDDDGQDGEGGDGDDGEGNDGGDDDDDDDDNGNRRGGGWRGWWGN